MAEEWGVGCNIFLWEAFQKAEDVLLQVHNHNATLLSFALQDQYKWKPTKTSWGQSFSKSDFYEASQVGYLLSALLFLFWWGEPCINEFIRLTIYSKLATMFSAVGSLLLAFLGNEEKFLDYQQAKGVTDICSIHSDVWKKIRCKGLVMCAW